MPNPNQTISAELLKDSSKEKLVEIIKDYPILWNPHSPEFKNTRYKDKRHRTWKECAGRWKDVLKLDEEITSKF